MRAGLKRLGPDDSFGAYSFDLVKKLCEEGQLDRAIQAVDSMHHGGLTPSTDILFYLLQGCINSKNLKSGRKVHRLITICGFVDNAFLGSHLIRMFTLCGSLWEATHVFDKILEPTVFTWNALISAHTMHGNAIQAIKVYQVMQTSDVKPDQHIFVAVLKACAMTEALAEGKLIHGHIAASISESNAYVGNTLIDMYVKCHSLEDAHSVFNRVSSRDVVTWTAIISGYGEHGYSLEAIRLFRQMQWEGMAPNSVTYVTIFKACSDLIMLDQGTFLHACITKSEFESDLTLGNTLVAMYAKCRRLKDAHDMLNRLPNRDIVTWNALIAANAHHGHGHDALLMFQTLQKEGIKPDDVTFISILKACSGAMALDQGKLIHAHIVGSGLESVLFVSNSLIDMYGKCGSLRDAYAVFRDLPKQDVVTWNTLIAGYAQHNHNSEALQIFQQMQEHGIEPDHVTFISTLQACSFLAALDYGKLIHVYIILSGIESDIYLHSSLIDMYTKCGSFEDAHGVFYQSSLQNMVMWNAMPASRTWHEHDEDSSKLLQREAMVAYGATFINILKACSTLVALDLGRLFHSRVIETFLELDMSIGNALIDMYAKCGSLEDACSVFHKMPDRGVVTWTTMIGAYGHHSDYKLASQYFEKMLTEGLRPVEITYICLLTACSRAGLVKEGCHHFKSMIKAHGLTPTLDHYYCIVDLFGRSGRLAEAEDVLQTLPFMGPSVVGLRTLLNHCKLHGNVELGQRCIRS